MESLSMEEKFRAAVNVIRSLPKKGAFQPSNELMLKFYSYYKQATEGPCTVAKPSFWDMINKAKWEAWKGLGNMPKEEAMKHYIDELKKIVETMSYTESVADFVDILGPFYEFVPLDDSDIKSDINGSQESDENNDTLIKEIVENNIDTLDSISKTEALKKQLKSKKANGDIRKDSFNNGQFPEAAYNALNSTNGHKENGAEESETDEYSDTYDQIGDDEEARENGNCMEDAGTSLGDNPGEFAGSSLPKGEKYNRITKARGGAEQRSTSSSNRDGGSGRRDRNPISRDSGHAPHISPAHYPQSGLSAGGSGNSGDGATGGGHPVDVGEQLALAVIKLQHTMDEVVARLDSLEVLLQEKQHDRNNQESSDKTLQWSLLGLSPSAAIFIVLWPFVAHWVMNVMKKKKQQR